MARGKNTRSQSRKPVESESEDEVVDAVSSEDEEEEVFDLAGDDEEQNSSEDDSEEDSDEDVPKPTHRSSNIAQLLDNLDPKLRQKVIMGRGGAASDSDEDDGEGADGSDEDGLRESSGWGKKGNYWSGDTADLEIGQDMEDAEDEEEAAKALRAEQLSRRKESDYLDEDDFEDDQEEDDLRKPTGGFGKDKLTEDLEFVAAGGVREDFDSTSVEQLTRDVSKMTKKQRMALLSAEAPEMMGLLEELNDRVKELHERIAPVKALIEQAGLMKPVEDDLCLYLEVKQQLLLSYCINTTFYLMLKAEGKSVRSHPVIKQLLHLRYAMEKMRALDGKVKYQVDRLLAAAQQSAETGASGVSALKPNVAALMRGDDSNDESASDSDDENRGFARNKSGTGSGVYRAPKAHAVPYMDEKDSIREEEKFQRKKKKLKNSEILETLREEFGQAPEKSSSSGIASTTQEQKQLQEEEDERRKFEEERFVRLTLSRKDKKSIKRREKLSQSQDMVTDMGDIGDFEDLEALSNSISARSFGGESGETTRASSVANGGDLANALQKAVSALTGGGSSAKIKGTKRSAAGAGVAEDGEEVSSHRRRLAPSSYDDDDDEYGNDDLGGVENDDGDEDLMESFARKKKDFVKRKAEHYTAPARIGGREEVVSDGGKRAASYEIMSNRGLTPHRKKSNRNPRVKKREAFAKAVVARKGQVREVVSGSTVAYGGESTGIKANLSRSRRIGS